MFGLFGLHTEKNMAIRTQVCNVETGTEEVIRQNILLLKYEKLPKTVLSNGEHVLALLPTIPRKSWTYQQFSCNFSSEHFTNRE